MGCGTSLQPQTVRIVPAAAQNGHAQNGHVQNGTAQVQQQMKAVCASQNNVQNTPANNNNVEQPSPVEPQEKEVATYTEESLQQFLSLQQKLEQLQKKNITGQYKAQHKNLVALYANLQESQRKVDTLKQQTAKEYQDVAYLQHPNVCSMFSNIYQLQSQIAKEQQEYMDALNRQEVAEKELNGIQEEYKALYSEVDGLRKGNEELEALQKEEETRLSKIFGGKYGSDVEEQLEDQTELLRERKELITTTRNQWHNAKILIQHAVSQLQYSTRRWAQIDTVNQELVKARYSMVTETRNYLIAASQNITNTHRYLGKVDIPYCNHEDLKILNHRIGTIFNDIMTRNAYVGALQTYQTLYIRSSHLLQWVTMVLEKTIDEDLREIIPAYNGKVSELKHERLRLINMKLRELKGEEGDAIIVPENDVPAVPEDDAAVLAEVAEAQSDTHIAQPDAVSLKEEEVESDKEDVAPPPTTDDPPEQVLATEPTHPQATPDKVEETSTDQAKESTTDTTQETSSDKAKETEGQAAAVPPAQKHKPLTELAPVPSVDTLFGNIEELKTKYEEQLAEFSKAQNVNKARVDQALEEKLRARRSRKITIELDKEDLEKGFKKLTGLF